MAVLAPIPRASDSTAAVVKTGLRRNARTPCQRSCHMHLFYLPARGMVRTGRAPAPSSHAEEPARAPRMRTLLHQCGEHRPAAQGVGLVKVIIVGVSLVIGRRHPRALSAVALTPHRRLT